ncbi:MAG: OsmC family protein [Promethearchaeota archaeon]
MSDEMGTKVSINLTEVESQMIFKCDMGSMKVKDCYIDEEHREEVDMLGPNPSRLLALGVLGCLSASFIFCLQKRGLKVDDFNSEAEVKIARNEKGFWRVKKINVSINPKITDPEALKRAHQCLKENKEGVSFFEEYCIVTQSVRSGINVELNVNL